MLLYNIFILNPFLPRRTVEEEKKKRTVQFQSMFLLYYSCCFIINRRFVFLSIYRGSVQKFSAREKKSVPKYAALLDFLSVLRYEFFNMFISSRFTLNFSYCISEGDNVCYLIMQ